MFAEHYIVFHSSFVSLFSFAVKRSCSSNIFVYISPLFIFAVFYIHTHADSYAHTSRAQTMFYSTQDEDNTHKLLLFIPSCCSLNSTEHFSADSSFSTGKKKTKKIFSLFLRTLQLFTCPAAAILWVATVDLFVPLPDLKKGTLERKQFPCLVWKLLFNLNYIATL